MAPQQNYSLAPMVEPPEVLHTRSLEWASRFLSHKLLLLVALALSVAALALTWLGPGRKQLLPMASRVSVVTGLSATDPCDDWPFIHLTAVLDNNLGGQGPDTNTEERISYKGVQYVKDEDTGNQTSKDIWINVYASSSYKAGHTKDNGIFGKYGLITLKGGNEASFRFEVVDEDGKPETLTKQEITFFDLDQATGRKNREYVIVKDMADMWLTQNTELRASTLPGGYEKFISTKRGDGKDNPKDPLALTVRQKNRAVTLEFANVHTLNVTLGNTEGRHTRYFMFVFRPSLLCAKTQGPVDGEEDKVVNVTKEKASTAPASIDKTETPSKKMCFWTVPVVNYCIDKFWEKWI